MKRLTKKRLGFGIGSFLLVMFIGWILADNHFAVAGNSSTVSVEYQVHVQSEGWKGYVSNGTTGGTTGKSRAIEAIKIKIKGMSGGIRYQTHLQKIGWTKEWKVDGQESGTTGQTRAIEAIRIELTGAVAKTHDVYYKVHIGEYGWLDWTKNGGIAGSTDCNMRMEAIQIKICPKNKKINTAKAFIMKPVLTTQAHVGKVGWQKAVSENSVSGTVEKGLRMEAMKIQCSDFSGGNGIQYRSHIQNTGWENNWRKSGETSGTTGRSLQMEAVQIKLTGQISKVFDIYYRVHVSDFGWLGWTKNGEAAGTTGGSKQMEAIQIRLMHKGDNSIKIGGAYIDLSVSNASNSFEMPLKNARCSWRSSSNWSWGNKGGTAARPYHIGIDILGSTDDVMATANGTVASYGYNDGNGNYVVLKHTISGKTVYSFYAHLNSSSNSLRKGQMVTKGTKIGVVGNTGNSRGKHLHFAIVDKLWTDGRYYGYATYFSGNKVRYGGVTYYNPYYVVRNNKLPIS